MPHLILTPKKEGLLRKEIWHIKREGKYYEGVNILANIYVEIFINFVLKFNLDVHRHTII